MSDDRLLQHIRESIGTGEILRVVYDGGSQPGTTRDLIPLKLDEHQLYAKCLSSGKEKSFLLASLRYSTELAATWREAIAPTFSSIEALAQYLKQELTADRWHIAHTADRVALHGLNKNGTPLKAADYALWFEEFNETQYDFVVGKLVPIKRQTANPWKVSAPNKKTAFFKHFESAATHFIQFLPR